MIAYGVDNVATLTSCPSGPYSTLALSSTHLTHTESRYSALALSFLMVSLLAPTSWWRLELRLRMSSSQSSRSILTAYSSKASLLIFIWSGQSWIESAERERKWKWLRFSNKTRLNNACKFVETSCRNCHFPTERFSILKPWNSSTQEVYVPQKRRLVDFKAMKVWYVQSGFTPVHNRVITCHYMYCMSVHTFYIWDSLYNLQIVCRTAMPRTFHSGFFWLYRFWERGRILGKCVEWLLNFPKI